MIKKKIIIFSRCAKQTLQRQLIVFDDRQYKNLSGEIAQIVFSTRIERVLYKTTRRIKF